MQYTYLIEWMDANQVVIGSWFCDSLEHCDKMDAEQRHNNPLIVQSLVWQFVKIIE